MTSSIFDSPEKIQYQVTRPQVPIVDINGKGKYNISPIGFPVRDYSAVLGVNPTLIQPTFTIGYTEPSNYPTLLRFANYRDLNVIPTTLSGLQRFSVSIIGLTHQGLVASAITDAAHGFNQGALIEISGCSDVAWNGNFNIKVTGANTFEYNLIELPTLSAIGSINASYTLKEDDIIQINVLLNPTNGYYKASISQWSIATDDTSPALITNANTTSNINLASPGLPLLSYPISSLSVLNGFATAITTIANGFANNVSITISGTTGYNGVHIVSSIDAFTFTFPIATTPIPENVGIVTYQVVANDMIAVTTQTNTAEDGFYKAVAVGPWIAIAFPYFWNGTENDNVAGVYVGGDNNGPYNHYRIGYSNLEITDFVRDSMPSVEFARAVASDKNQQYNGQLTNWFKDGGRINLGQSGQREVWVDGFGLGQPGLKIEESRSNGPIDTKDPIQLQFMRSYRDRMNKVVNWGLTDNIANSKVDDTNKAPYLYDYPNVANTEVLDTDFLSGGFSEPNIMDRMSFGTNGYTSPMARTFARGLLWWMRGNSYHNNITLDMSAPSVFGKHNIAIWNRLYGTADPIFARELFIQGNVDLLNNAIKLLDQSQFQVNDYIVFYTKTSLPAPLVQGTVYQVQAIGVNGITIKDLSGVTIVLTNVGGLQAHTIERIAFPTNSISDVISELDSFITNSTSVSGLLLLSKEVVGTRVRYLYKQRDKDTITDIILKGTGTWTTTLLTYSVVSPSITRVYLESSETMYAEFTDLTGLINTATLIQTLKDSNDLIPYPFNPSLIPTVALDCLFATSNLVDWNNTVNDNEIVWSKKTFIHLPTPIGLPDGTKIDVDFNLPMEPDTLAFPSSTIGTLSGYRNYATQPRAYVISGKQISDCTNRIVTALSQVNGMATLTTTDDWNVLIENFTDSDVVVNVQENFIQLNYVHRYSVNDPVYFKLISGTPPAPLQQNTKYLVESFFMGQLKLKDENGVSVPITSTGSGSFRLQLGANMGIIVKGALPKGYNGKFIGRINGFKSITFAVPTSLAATATGIPIVDKIQYADGQTLYKGLTERDNQNLFSPTPELEFATATNIYHQFLKPTDLINSDKRVLLASVYPTSTSTFMWRIDNDPQLRLISWALMNPFAMGIEGPVENYEGSFSAVAYKRNKDIKDIFGSLFNFSVTDNPLSYNTEYATEPNMASQFINGYVRTWFRPKQTANDNTFSLDSSSFQKQASKAYIELTQDFLKGSARVSARKDYNGFSTAQLGFTEGYNGNHGPSAIPTSFFDQTAGQEFIVYNTVALPYTSSDNPFRWLSKALYAPSYIVNATGVTAMTAEDSFRDTGAFKTYLQTEYFLTWLPKENNAGNRYVPSELNPPLDPLYEFGAGPGLGNSFTKYLDKKGYAGTITDSDFRRLSWDSYYNIPSANDRQVQNMYNTDSNYKDVVKFFGFYWMPFAKVFSTDYWCPTSVPITDIKDYALITGGTNPTQDATLGASLRSDPVATKFFNDGYINTFASLNTIDLNPAYEQYMRDWITGYSNGMPIRFYNNYRILVSGKTTSSSYANDTNLSMVWNESNSQREYIYSVNEYLTDYGSPTSLNGQYLDDNFSLQNVEYQTNAVTAEDYNAAWVYFEEGSPNSANPTIAENSKVKELITVSGQNYIADRLFYRSKMKQAFVRMHTSFVFSSRHGRWYTLESRQGPTSYLTPTFGNAALEVSEKSINSTTQSTERLWQTTPCFDSKKVYRDVYESPYFLHQPMDINKGCLPYLSQTFPYDINGNRNPVFDPSIDSPATASDRFGRLLEPQKPSPTGIGFVVPNNISGGRNKPNDSLFLWQPNLWSVYWNMRPVVSTMDGTDIPGDDVRKGGLMSDPVLRDMYAFPDASNLTFTVPWFFDMNQDWMEPTGYLIIDAAFDDYENNNKRLCFTDIDALITNTPNRIDYPEFDAFRGRLW